MSKITRLFGGLTVALALGLSAGAQAQDKVLKIGVLGVMSGPAASWRRYRRRGRRCRPRP